MDTQAEPRAGGRRPLLTVSGLVLLLAAAAMLGRPGGGAGKVRHALSLGIARQPGSALLFVARDAGLAEREGLDLAATTFVSGKRALEALRAGTVDAISSGETPIVVDAFRPTDLRILASLSSSDNEPRIVARRDRGIAGPADLRGKTVSTQRASAVHFFLHLFLLKHGLSTNEVRVVFHRPEDLVAALAAGDVDAISMREPFVSEARRALPGLVTVLDEPGLYLRHELLVTTDAALAAKPEPLRRLLAASLKAEALARHEPARAARILQNALGLGPAGAASALAEQDLRVQLAQTLVIGLEDEARWASGCVWAGQGAMPNVLKLLEPGLLGGLAPDRVNVLGAAP